MAAEVEPLRTLADYAFQTHDKIRYADTDRPHALRSRDRLGR